VSRRNSNPPDIWAAVGWPYNQAVVEPTGRKVHLTGQVAWDLDLNIVGGDDPEQQANAALENVARILADLGGTLDDIVSLTTLYCRSQDITGINRARSSAFRKDTGPASTSYIVSGFVYPGLLVEFQAIAVIPEDRFKG
jgi:enamine deaminase RidA (YjgF/YER057c/UK114 family)